MKRRGHTVASTRHRKAAKPKRSAPTIARRDKLSVADLQAQTSDLTRELGEARDQLTATSDVLRVISNSPTNLQSALGAIAESAARLLDVVGAEISRVEGDGLRLMAKHGSLPQRLVGSIRPINRSWVTGRAVVDRTTIQVLDLQAAENEFPEGAASARQFGHRTTLATPLLRAGNPIGAILIRRMDVRPFTDKQISLLQNFAAQAVIAIENARLLNELRESLDHQTATADILRVIASTPEDSKRALDTIAETGRADVQCYQRQL
jgi:two-component system, NtrC family, sensor kinase